MMHDLAKKIRQQVIDAIGDAARHGPTNIAHTVNIGSESHVTAIWSDDEKTVVHRDGKTTVIHHDEPTEPEGNQT